MKKLVFLDFDGTIVDHTDHTIPRSAKTAIERARNNGHEVILATGRPPALMGALSEEIHFDAVVGANGRYISYKGEVLRKKVIPRKLLDRFKEDMKQKGIDIAFIGVNDYFMQTEPTEYALKMSDLYHVPIPKKVTDPEALNEVLQLVMFLDHDGDFESFSREYPELDFNMSSPFSADVNTKDGLKEIGLKVFTERLGIPMENTVAIGDGHNDVTMIQHAGTGVAMGNGCEALKAAADIVTDDVSDDGLFKAFEKLELI